MSNFVPIQKKGLAQCLIESSLDPEKLHFHISEIAPGTRAHPPHTHTGVEAFYVLSGEGTMEVEGESYRLETNSAILLDPSRLHGLVNTGAQPLRYMVIIAR